MFCERRISNKCGGETQQNICMTKWEKEENKVQFMINREMKPKLNNTSGEKTETSANPR
jgi:hypothetical protein